MESYLDWTNECIPLLSQGSKRKSSVDGDSATPSKQPKVSLPSSSEMGENSSKETQLLSSKTDSKEKVSQPSSSETGENSSKETQQRDTQSQDMETQSSLLILSTPDSQVSQREPESELRGEEEEEEKVSASSDSCGADLVEKDATTEDDVGMSMKSEEVSSRDVSVSKLQKLAVSPHTAAAEVSLDVSQLSLAQVAETEHSVCVASLQVHTRESSMEEAMEVDGTDALQLDQGDAQAPPSLVLHDHSYCSQDSSQPGPVEDLGNETTAVADSSQYDSSRTKLSSASQDHTYCSRESTDSVEPSTSPYPSPQILEPGIESSESQELFSYDQTLSEHQRERFSTEQSSQTEQQDTVSNCSQTESPGFLSVAVNTDPANPGPLSTIQSALETVQSASACLSDTGNLERADVAKLCLFIRMCSDVQQQLASLLQKKCGSEA